MLRFWLDDDGRGGARGTLRDSLVASFVVATLREGRRGVDAGSVASMLLARWHGATTLYATRGAVDFDAEAERAVQELERMIGR